MTDFTSLDVDIWSKRTKYTVMDNGLRFPKVLRTEISQDLGCRSSGATGCTCDVVPQMTVISQLGVYIRGLQLPCSVGCVSSGSQYHQLAFCVFCSSENLS